MKVETVVAGILAVVGGTAMAAGFGILLSMWAAWWLLPVWGSVLVPLGVPPVAFWHLVALRMFLNAMLPHPMRDSVKQAYKEDAGPTLVAHVFTVATIPVVAYYVILWYMA